MIKSCFNDKKIMEIILAKLKLNSTSSIKMCIICQKSMKNGEEGIKSEMRILT